MEAQGIYGFILEMSNSKSMELDYILNQDKSSGPGFRIVWSCQFNGVDSLHYLVREFYRHFPPSF